MVPKQVLCFAHGRKGDWEAICVDFDIAVQGQSFDDVRNRLEAAVCEYVEDALREDPVTRERLLSRKAPLGLKLNLVIGCLVHLAFGSKREVQESRAGFDLPCPA